MDNMQNDISFEKVLADYASGNRISVNEMLKQLTETAGIEEKCKFAEYVLFVEPKYKDGFIEDTALAYIVEGTDKGYKLGAELLIRYVIREKLLFDIWDRAIVECQKLIDTSENETDKIKYGQWMGCLYEMKAPDIKVGETPVQSVAMEQPQVQEQTPVQEDAKKKKKARKQAEKVIFKKRDIITSLLYIISSVLWIVVFAYFFLDVHSEVWSTNAIWHKIPKISKYLVIPIPFYNDWMNGYIGYGGMFALELATIATLLTSLGKWCNRLKIANILKTFSDLACAIFIGLHALLLYKAGFSVFLNIQWYLIMFGVSILLGCILGLVGRKILKLDV